MLILARLDVRDAAEPDGPSEIWKKQKTQKLEKQMKERRTSRHGTRTDRIVTSRVFNLPRRLG